MTKNKKLTYGLIGFPVKHSLSACMHNAAFNHCQIDAQYRLFEVRPEELKGFLCNPKKQLLDTEGNLFTAKDIIGFNITIPHKVEALLLIKDTTTVQSLDVLLTGAINTVKRGDKLNYWNTDPIGFRKSLKEDLKFDPKGKNVLLIGCGGAGRAVLAAFSQIQPKVSKIYIYETNSKTIETFKQHLNSFEGQLGYAWEFIASQDIAETIRQCQLLVNASPVGMKAEDPELIDKKLLHRDLFIYDIVYNRDTRLIAEARELGLRALGGLGMLLHQGAAAWELWMERPAPIEEMRGALNLAIEKYK